MTRPQTLQPPPSAPSSLLSYFSMQTVADGRRLPSYAADQRTNLALTRAPVGELHLG